MTDVTIHPGGHVTAVVQPGFNSKGLDNPIQALQAEAKMEIFSEEFRKLLESKTTFTMVLGDQFETADVTEGLRAAPCMGLASVEQLKFLKSHGLVQILMARVHGTLVQNAKAVGIDVIAGRA